MSGKSKNVSPSRIIEALDLSENWYRYYVETHKYEYKAFTSDVVSHLAIARYAWLIAIARDTVLAMFDNKDFLEIVCVIQSEVAIPSDYPLAKAVADDNEIIWHEYHKSSLGGLIDKLLSLSAVQEMALRDILERYCYGGSPSGVSLESFLNNERAHPSTI